MHPSLDYTVVKFAHILIEFLKLVVEGLGTKHPHPFPG